MTGSEIITYLSSIPAMQTAVSAIVGGLITAIFLRHNTETEEFAKIKMGLFKQVIDDLLKNGRMTYSEYFKTKNLLSIARKADEYNSSMPHTDDKRTYDFDWFMRFYEAVGNVSDEEMQNLWAKILAGEVSRPSSYSLRTLEIMRNISKAEAKLFRKIYSCSFKNGDSYYLPRYVNYLKRFDITYDCILELEEIGLINADSSIKLDINVDIEPRALYSNDSIVITIKSNDRMSNVIKIDQFPFTRVGTEIASLMACAIHDQSLLSLARELRDIPGFDVAVYEILSRENGNIIIGNCNLIEK